MISGADALLTRAATLLRYAGDAGGGLAVPNLRSAACDG